MFDQTTNVTTAPPASSGSSDPKSIILKYIVQSLSQSGAQSLPSNLSQISNAKGVDFSDKIWHGANQVKEVNKQVAIPVFLALSALIEDRKKRAAIARQLSRMSAVAASPAVASRTLDLLTRILSSNDKMKAINEMAPQSLMKSLGDMGPSILYHLNSLT